MRVRLSWFVATWLACGTALGEPVNEGLHSDGNDIRTMSAAAALIARDGVRPEVLEGAVEDWAERTKPIVGVIKEQQRVLRQRRGPAAQVEYIEKQRERSRTKLHKLGVNASGKDLDWPAPIAEELEVHAKLEARLRVVVEAARLRGDRSLMKRASHWMAREREVHRKRLEFEAQGAR